MNPPMNQPEPPEEPPSMWPSPSDAPAAPVVAVQTSSNAIVALVLAIAAWPLCPVIFAIIALVFASKADREIAASNGWVTGGGLVTAAKIVAWINIGLYGALIAIGVLVLIVAAVGGALV